MTGTLDPEVEEELAALRESLAGHVDEQVVAAQWFRPAGWGSSARGLGRFLRRLAPFGGKDAQTRLTAMNVMALTESRVVVYTLGTATGAMRARRAVAEWPLAEVSIGTKGHTVDTVRQPGGPEYREHTRTDMTLVTLRGRGGQPLLLEGDFPQSALTGHLVESIKGAVAA